MKKYLLTFLGFCFAAQLHAQKFELNVNAYSGLFHYSGSGTAPVSFINEGNPNYTNNPYGSKNGFCYGGGLRLQYISKGGFIVGIGADYEVLRSKEDINYYNPYYFYLADTYYSQINYETPVKGQTFLQREDININPYIGYRINANKIKIDLMPGIDVGFNVNTYDKGKATDDSGNTYQTNLKIAGTPTDIRLRFGVVSVYKRFGIMVSYAYGLTNLDKNAIGNGNNDANSELFRFGLTYRIF